MTKFYYISLLLILACVACNNDPQTANVNSNSSSQDSAMAALSGQNDSTQHSANNAHISNTNETGIGNSAGQTSLPAQNPNIGQNPKDKVMEASTSSSDSKVVELPDGTKVILNRASQARYEEAADELEKNIVLKGEAYFDVKPATIKVKKFNVYAGNTRTTVTGTKFNLRAYDNENLIVLEVLEGEVEFVVLTTQQKQMVRAGERAIYNRKDGTLRSEKITGEEFKWWLKTNANQGSGANTAKTTSADCAAQFISNTNVKGQINVQTISILLVVKTDFDYTLDFSATNAGAMGKIVSTDNSRPLLKDDKIMFVAETEEKRSFAFVYEGEKRNIQGRSAYINNFKISVDDMKWLANNKIKQVRFMDMAVNKMYPQPLSADRTNQLQKLASCTLQAIE